MTSATYTIHRGEIWNLTGSPSEAARPEDAFETFVTGGLVVSSSGSIAGIGSFDQVSKGFPNAKVVDHSDSVIIPGFVDGHLHFPQMDMIGSHGKGLLDWLDHYTFPEENRFHDAQLAEKVANRLCFELKANGVTTAAIYSSTHAAATDALFSAAAAAELRVIAGKVAMDQNCPKSLQQSLETQISETNSLIKKWHQTSPLLHYAITPRFAPACSASLLQALGQLKSEHPGVYVQSHHAETKEEIELVQAMHPKHADYLSVYKDYGLLGPRTLLGHCIYTTAAERQSLAATKTKVIHCPTSNMFLGSGLMNHDQLKSAGVTIGLGSDIGGGTSLSPFRTMASAYKTQVLQNSTIHPLELFYLATLGGAKSLCLENDTGSFAVGKSADFSVLNPHQHRLLSERFRRDQDPIIRLFATIIHGDDRIVESVYVRGKCLLKPIKD